MLNLCNFLALSQIFITILMRQVHLRLDVVMVYGLCVDFSKLLFVPVESLTKPVPFVETLLHCLHYQLSISKQAYKVFLLILGECPTLDHGLGVDRRLLHLTVVRYTLVTFISSILGSLSAALVRVLTLGVTQVF